MLKHSQCVRLHFKHRSTFYRYACRPLETWKLKMMTFWEHLSSHVALQVALHHGWHCFITSLFVNVSAQTCWCYHWVLLLELFNIKVANWWRNSAQFTANVTWPAKVTVPTPKLQSAMHGHTHAWPRRHAWLVQRREIKGQISFRLKRNQEFKLVFDRLEFKRPKSLWVKFPQTSRLQKRLVFMPSPTWFLRKF